MYLHNECDHLKKASFIKARLVIAILVILCPILCKWCAKNLQASFLNGTSSSDETSHARKDNVTSIIFIEPLSDVVRGFGSQMDFHQSYILFLIPSARLAEHSWIPKLGAMWILVVASLGSAFMNFIAPLLASISKDLATSANHLIGMFQAAIYPACYVLLSKWLQPSERSLVLPIMCACERVSYYFLDLLFDTPKNSGWFDSVYVPGVLCLVWSSVWIWYGSNELRNQKHFSIGKLFSNSSIELHDVPNHNSSTRRVHDTVSSIEGPGTAADARTAQTVPAHKWQEISWRKLRTSRSIWVMMIAILASSCNLYAIQFLSWTQATKNERSSGDIKLQSTLHHEIYFILSLLVGVGSDFMIKRRAFSFNRLKTRKLFQCVALAGQAICFVGIAWFGQNSTRFDHILTIQIVLLSLVNGGEVHLPSELSTEFPGTIYAIGEFTRKLMYVIFIIAGLMIKKFDDSYPNDFDMNKVCYPIAMISGMSSIIFFVFHQDELKGFLRDPEKPPLPLKKVYKSYKKFIISPVSTIIRYAREKR